MATTKNPAKSVETQAREAEQAVRKALRDDDRVPFYIPEIDGAPYKEQYFTRSINGVFINIKRGEQVTVPRWIANFINEQERIRKEAEGYARPYMSKNGKEI